MYDELARAQRPSYLEWLVANMFVPTVLITFALQARADLAARPRGASFDTTIVVLPVLGIDEGHREPIPELFPVLISMPRPIYPPGLGVVDLQPRVFLRALVDRTGRVSRASIDIVQSPDPVLNEQAARALMAAVFRPARLNGHPIAAWITIAVTFNTFHRE
jgi:TonB family protein